MNAFTKMVVSGEVVSYDTCEGTWDVEIGGHYFLSDLLKRVDGKHVRVTVEVIEGVE